MTFPGFAAEASLYKSPNVYRRSEGVGVEGRPATVSAAVYWGVPGGQHGFKDDGCMDKRVLCGYRKYSAILFDIPWGQSWEDTCAGTPADVAGQHFDRPSNCVNFGPGINEWGEFYVRDQACGGCYDVPRTHVDPCCYEECVYRDPVTGECQWSCVSCVVTDGYDQVCC